MPPSTPTLTSFPAAQYIPTIPVPTPASNILNRLSLLQLHFERVDHTQTPTLNTVCAELTSLERLWTSHPLSRRNERRIGELRGRLLDVNKKLWAVEDGLGRALKRGGELPHLVKKRERLKEERRRIMKEADKVLAEGGEVNVEGWVLESGDKVLKTGPGVLEEERKHLEDERGELDGNHDVRFYDDIWPLTPKTRERFKRFDQAIEIDLEIKKKAASGLDGSFDVPEAKKDKLGSIERVEPDMMQKGSAEETDETTKGLVVVKAVKSGCNIPEQGADVKEAAEIVSDDSTEKVADAKKKRRWALSQDMFGHEGFEAMKKMAEKDGFTSLKYY